jgi:hypothetical protein
LSHAKAQRREGAAVSLPFREAEINDLIALGETRNIAGNSASLRLRAFA